ncbi:MAG TPA: acyl-CoA dehydrogenase family protein [Acidimicrobiales bacterium]|nr:acyl-CoA dehydrogenase family protein [Acidimicrobiales bacterium]
MTAVEPASDPNVDFRAEVRAELASLLDPRDPAAAALVLGAGSDDVESGRAYLKRLAEGGWAVPEWPVEHGGRGLDRERADVVREVLEGFDTPDMYPFLVGIDLIGPTILAHGSDEQKARYLPPMRDGSEIWCQMFSEPDAGSDLANVKTKAVRDGDVWRLSGSKVWTSRAHYSRWGLCLARTDTSVPKHAGITAFCVDLERPGVTVRPLVQMNGDAHFNEVFLDEVEVPDADRLDDPGRGWKVAITCLSFERGALAGDQGITVGRLAELARGGGAVQRDRVAGLVAQLRVNQASALRAQAARRAGQEPGPADSGAKIRTNRLVTATARAALEVEGAAATVGLDRPDPWQTMFLVSPSLTIRGGSDEIQHNILGERVLGLPPEPRVDKDRPFSDRPDQ